MSADRLVVWLGDAPVAVLDQLADRDLELAYLDECVRRLGVGSLCLSASLPVQSRAFAHGAAFAWVDGVLPEGDARTALEDRFDIRRGDTFGLLATIGRDCAGAVSFLRDGDEPDPRVETTPLDDDALAAAVDALPANPLGNDDDVRVSLGGLQAKLLLRRVDGDWERPLHGTPSTHILKPDPPRYPGLVAAEGAVMAHAGAAGLDVAAVELLDVAGRPVLAVERFDRRVVDGVVTRLHQEDGCQALGVAPQGRAKYESSGSGVSYAALAALLERHAADVDAELVRLTQRMVLDVAVGNTDAHARNHGFLVESGTLGLAPAYDVSPAVDFAPSQRLALHVCGVDELRRVHAVQLRLEARSWGTAPDIADGVVDSTLELLATVEWTALGPGAPDDLADRLRERVRAVIGHR